jgi:acetyl-CoA carboxylase biotin carboxyl carrier protein
MVGVFYRSSGPESPPFVEIGDLVRVGQTVGLIEAMKVFSEIPCDAAGRVVAIPATNGRLVQPGEALLVIDTEGMG